MSYHILVTGARGFVGKNFVEALKNVKQGKDKAHIWNTLGNPSELQIYEYDLGCSEEELEEYCKKANFVFHFAGVNRPKDPEEYMQGNFGFSAKLLDTLRKYHNNCPVVLSSSIQAGLEGKYADSEYGRSKLAGEQLFIEYGQQTGANILVFRLPNLFGKWCRPNYNSAVATFCNNIANDLPIQVNSRDTELQLVYIDDFIEELFLALDGNEHRLPNGYCFVPEVHVITLGAIVDLLYVFHESRNTLQIPDMTKGSFSKKLYATYLSYYSPSNFSYPVKMHVDNRGSFTELFKTPERGQVSVNVCKPGIIKGQHWHHTKNEKFVVVSGSGLIQLRKIGTDPNTGEAYPIVEYPVDGEKITVVDMAPGYTHNIINLSSTDDLVTVIWCNECFDSHRPDTFMEEV